MATILSEGGVDHFGKMGTQQLLIVQQAGICRLWFKPALDMQAAYRELLPRPDFISVLVVSPPSFLLILALKQETVPELWGVTCNPSNRISCVNSTESDTCYLSSNQGYFH